MSEANGAPPPPFGDPYYRARKAYGLCSGLLIGWALIGVEINSTPIENIHVVLESPDAVPYVLVVLIVYFAFRVSVEWFQTPLGRRALVPSRVDIGVAHAIGFLALGLYFGQMLFRLRLAEALAIATANGAAFGAVDRVMSSLLGFLTGAAVSAAPILVARILREGKVSSKVLYVYGVPVLLGIVVWFLPGPAGVWWPSFVLGFPVAPLMYMWGRLVGWRGYL